MPPQIRSNVARTVQPHSPSDEWEQSKKPASSASSSPPKLPSPPAWITLFPAAPNLGMDARAGEVISTSTGGELWIAEPLFHCQLTGCPTIAAQTSISIRAHKSKPCD